MELSNINDLEALKVAGIKEGEKWEFKSVWPANSNVEKSICAFANTAGGIILLGVNYDDVNNQIIGFPGIDKRRGLEERAVDIGGNIGPRIVPSSWLIDVGAGKTVQVIQVFKSRMIPHMASNYIYYQRVDKENVPISESLIEKLYLARQVQEKEADAFLREKQYFNFGGDPHWLSISFCPLYLEADLISHTRSNLYFMNSLIELFDPRIVDIYFHTVPDGYRFEIPHQPADRKALYNYLIHVFNNGVMVFGMWIEDQEPFWETINFYFLKLIPFYNKLQKSFRYPGWTKIILLLTNMRDTKMKFPNSRMNDLSKPMIHGDLFIQMDFEDSRIAQDNAMKIIEPIYTKVKVYYGLDDYIV